MNFCCLLRSFIMAALLVFTAMTAHAADSDEWEFGAEAYLWGASIDAKPNGGDNIHISFSDILDNLDGALMATLSAHKGKWSLFSDIIYLDIEDDQ